MKNYFPLDNYIEEKNFCIRFSFADATLHTFFLFAHFAALFVAVPMYALHMISRQFVVPTRVSRLFLHLGPAMPTRVAVTASLL